MGGERDERLYLTDIKDAIDRVLSYTAGGRETFLADLMMQDAVIRNIEIMGEAAKGVSQITRGTHPEIPWKKIAGIRDRVIHGYFRVDLDIVWEVVDKELPRLREQVGAILSQR